MYAIDSHMHHARMGCFFFKKQSFLDLKMLEKMYDIYKGNFAGMAYGVLMCTSYASKFISQDLHLRIHYSLVGVSLCVCYIMCKLGKKQSDYDHRDALHISHHLKNIYILDLNRAGLR